MDINDNLLQTNTFVKGMNTDVSDMMMDNAQYRYAENIRLVTDTSSNTGEVRLIEGLLEMGHFDGYRIVYLNSIRGYIVLILIDDDKKWGIYVFNGDKWHWYFKNCTEKIWTVEDEEGPQPYISGVLRHESDDDVKFYFVDDTCEHGIMCINIASETPNQQNVPSDIHFLVQHVEGGLPMPKVSISEKNGTLYPAKVLYAYRLYKLNGRATNVAPLSKVLSLYKNLSEGSLYNLATKNAVDIKISVPNNIFYDMVQIYRITHAVNGLQPTVQLIRDMSFDKSVEVVDLGTNRYQISLEEFLALDSVLINPKILESKDDYLFSANIKYSTDKTNKLFSDWDSRSYSSGNKNAAGKSITPTDIATDSFNGYDWPNVQFDGGHQDYQEDLWYKPDVAADSIGGTGPNVQWRLIPRLIEISLADGKVLGDCSPVFKHDETYRFGIVLYDTEGAASSVKWIADIRIPPFNYWKDIEFYAANGGATYYTRQASTIKYRCWDVLFDINLPKGCSGYEIVRCQRTVSDKRVLFLGIAGYPLLLSAVTTEATKTKKKGSWWKRGIVGALVGSAIGAFGALEGALLGASVGASIGGATLLGNDTTTKVIKGSVVNLFPSGLFTTTLINVNTLFAAEMGLTSDFSTAESCADVLQFACPEFSYLPDDVKNLLDTYSNSISAKGVAHYGVASNVGSSNESVWPEITIQDPYRHPGIAEEDKSPYLYGSIVTKTVKAVGTSVGSPGTNSFVFESVKRDDDGYYLYVEPALLKYNLSADNNVYRKAVDKEETVNFNLVTPSLQLFNTSVKNDVSEIDYVAYAHAPLWSQFANGEDIIYRDDITVLRNGFLFINWSTPCIPDKWMGDIKTLFKRESFDNIDVINMPRCNWVYYPVGAGGSCVLLSLREPIDPKFGTYAPDVMTISVYNIVKTHFPYGGVSKDSIENSTYYSFGDYHPSGDTKYVTVRSGDGYVGLFFYNALHMWDDAIYRTVPKMSTVYIVPIESDMDLNGVTGTRFSADLVNGYAIQDIPASISHYNYILTDGAYLYNTAYNQQPVIKALSPVVSEVSEPVQYDNRIIHSQPKTNNELIDSWMMFKSNNYMDVDSKYGELTDIKRFKDKLIYWQPDAAGIIGSNERVVVQDNNSANVVLGQGGVLQRFDYITTTYGMKPNQFASTHSNNTLYWWDGSNKEILAYAGGTEISPLSTIKNIQNYLHSRDENKRPSLVYNSKYKEIIMSIVNDESITYSELILAFTSVYTFMFEHNTAIVDTEIISNKQHLAKINNIGNAVSYGYIMNEENELHPKLQYVVNKQSTMTKTFDLQTFGGRLYGGSEKLEKNNNEKHLRKNEHDTTPLNCLTLEYNTPLKQHTAASGEDIFTNREYDFRLDIPRALDEEKPAKYGNRMRGKTMQCELSSDSNSTDFSLQYITTKYRISWS